MSTKIEDKPIAHAGADGSPRCAVSPGSVTYTLFKHMADEHGLTLLESELAEIVRLVNDTLDERLRWWNTYAEREREMLIGFREAVRRIAAKPIDSSDMMDEIEHLLSLLPNT